MYLSSISICYVILGRTDGSIKSMRVGLMLKGWLMENAMGGQCYMENQNYEYMDCKSTIAKLLRFHLDLLKFSRPAKLCKQTRYLHL